MNISFAEEAYIRSVEALMAAEQEEAETFLATKHATKPPRSDWEARAMTLIETEGKTTKLRAMTEVYLARLRREDADQR